MIKRVFVILLVAGCSGAWAATLTVSVLSDNVVVDFYLGELADGYGRRDGAQFLASDTCQTPGALKTLTLTLAGGVGPDWHCTALATDADGNTSEFAPARSLGEVVFRGSYED